MKPSRRVLALLLCHGAFLRAQVNVVTANYDNYRTGANLNEGLLNASNVNAVQFGKLFALPVDGQVYAQPLYVHGLAFPGGTSRNLLYVATMHNSVYAFDADALGGTSPVWQVNFGQTVNPHDFDIPGLPYDDIQSEIGILSTPVINISSNTIYVVNYSARNGEYDYYLHALDLVTGNEKFNGPVRIQGTVPGTGWGGLNDAVNGQLAFQASRHLQRPALLLVNGAVYVAFGSHGDEGPWHGWLMGYRVSDLSQQTALFCVSPSAAAGSIWQGGRGPAADDQGNIYVVTGNGSYDGVEAWSQSILRLAATPNIVVGDWFTPSLWNSLNDGDQDFGSSGPILIPGTNLLLAAGKAGIAVLVNRGDMGHEAPSDSQVLQSFSVAETGGFSIFNAALWPLPDGPIVYYWPFNETLSAYQMSNGTFATMPLASNNSVYSALPFNGMSVSANGSTAGTGILWATSTSSSDLPAPGVLHAFDAGNVAVELWNSDQSGGRDTLGWFSKFSNPTVANGKVYVATQSNSVVAYGLLPVPGVASVINAASFRSGAVSPGELITIFGRAIGPDAAATAQPSGGQLPFSLAGASVLFDGKPAPLLFVSSGQVNAVVPFSVAGRATTKMVVVPRTGLTFTVNLAVAPAAPAFFTQNLSGTGQGAILNNANLSVNSPASPAARGSVVALYATGLGSTDPPSSDGAIAAAGALPRVALPVTVTIGRVKAQVIYQGAAPGLVAGVTQIDAQVPADIEPGPAVTVTMMVGATASQNVVTVAVN